MIERVAQQTGQLPKVTYCLTNEFITDRLDDAIRFYEQGHEIGVHSHLPGSHRKAHSYSGRCALALDRHGFLNQDRVAGPLREIITSLGFPAPQTHVSGMFSFQQSRVQPHPQLDARFSRQGGRISREHRQNEGFDIFHRSQRTPLLFEPKQEP
ncbi:MAG: hypothetical protein ACOC4K_03110 [Verrucomicrobiota bacterium]